MGEKDTLKIVGKMASLARLSLGPAEIAGFAEKAGAVIAYVRELSKLDTSGIEPTSHAIETEGRLRDDVARPSGTEEGIVAQAPETDGGFVQVPRVIEGE
jgi:aspartyl-tRNA(Asn)/glutamyl-tRNA(Gln) amidotransferase subunit C